MLLQDGQIEIRWRFSTVSYGSASSGRLQKRRFLKFKIFEYIFYLFNVCISSISIRHIYLVDHILHKYIFNITILTHELMCNLIYFKVNFHEKNIPFQICYVLKKSLQINTIFYPLELTYVSGKT